MNLIASKLLKDLDQLKLERYPLPAHYAMKADSHAREVYAVFLAGVLLSGERISDNQTRLFQMLLASLSLEKSQASLYERAKETDQDLLREFFRIIDEHDLAQSFIVDAAVLCRIEHELTEQQVILFSEIADSLKLTMHQMDELMALVAIILGLPSDKAFSIDYDYSKFSVWDEFAYKLLTAEQLQSGLIPGRWVLDRKIEMLTPWSMSGVTLKFLDRGEINTCCVGAVTLENSKLVNPILNFSDEIEFSLLRTEVSGMYSDLKNKSAISLSSIKSSLMEKVLFSINNARALLVANTDLIIKKCNFDGCGSRHLNGGALNFIDNSLCKSLRIENTVFSKCIARLGGAIKTTSLIPGSVLDCKFDDCFAFAYESCKKENNSKYLFSGAAIFSDKALFQFNGNSGSCISNTLFMNNSIRLGDCYDSSRAVFVKNSNFQNSMIVYHNLYHANRVQEGSSGGVLLKDWLNRDEMNLMADFTVDIEEWFNEC